MAVRESLRGRTRAGCVGGAGSAPGGGGAAVLSQTLARAALGLERPAFELAVQLGHISTVPGPGGRRMVSHAEIARLGSEEGFPETLLERIQLVGTFSGAEMIEVSRDRFVKLARLGCFRPAQWYLNRYRAVVWLYPAEEVREFARTGISWLTGRLPEEARARLEAGEDRRAEGWRARRTERMVADATDAWHEAAAWCALLGPEETADLVTDPVEHAYLCGLHPSRAPSPTASLAAEPPAVSPFAEAPEEIDTARAALGFALHRARLTRPAPGGAHDVREPSGRGRREPTSQQGRWETAASGLTPGGADTTFPTDQPAPPTHPSPAPWDPGRQRIVRNPSPPTPPEATRPWLTDREPRPTQLWPTVPQPPVPAQTWPEPVGPGAVGNAAREMGTPELFGLDAGTRQPVPQQPPVSPGPASPGPAPTWSARPAPVPRSEPVRLPPTPPGPSATASVPPEPVRTTPRTPGPWVSGPAIRGLSPHGPTGPGGVRPTPSRPVSARPGVTGPVSARPGMARPVVPGGVPREPFPGGPEPMATDTLRPDALRHRRGHQAARPWPAVPLPTSSAPPTASLTAAPPHPAPSSASPPTARPTLPRTPGDRDAGARHPVARPGQGARPRGPRRPTALRRWLRRR
ncbi:DUF6397 family protein [Streptantibioticus cattleyicolor]|nr:exported protein of unknown function [Streptantibioticus cattleyicolor NRRL 8057 = DSM 46488]